MTEETQPDPIQPEEIQPEPVPVPEKRNWLRYIFTGPNGIRAGWSVAIFILLFTLIDIIVTFSFSKIPFLSGKDDVIKPGVQLVRESGMLAALLLATWVMALIEKRKLMSYGFDGESKLKPALIGTLWGFAALSVLVLVISVTGFMQFNGLAINGIDIVINALIYALVFVLVGITEEFLFRGYLQYTLTRGMGFWLATLVVAILFTLAHTGNGGETFLGLFSVALASLLFSVILWYTRSLWWGIGFHAGWDWAQSYFYGTPDSGLLAKGHLLNSHPIGNALWSGGSAGPEGSAFLIPLFIIMMAIMYFVWKGKGKAGILATNAQIAAEHPVINNIIAE